MTVLTLYYRYDVVCFFLKPNSRYLCISIMYDILLEVMRGATAHTGVEPWAQNGCNELPARHSNRTSRVGEVCKQIRRDGRCGRV